MKKLTHILIALLLLVGFTTQAYSAGPLCRTLQTGQTTQYDSQEDDGYYEKGIPHDYTVLTTGDRSGTTNIVINGKTHALSNNCVWDNRTGLMWARYVPDADIGPAADGKLFWQQWTLVARTVTFAEVGGAGTDTITADAGTPFDTGALCVGRKFTVSGTASNDGTYTVSAISTSVITTTEDLADEASISTDFATVDDLIWDFCDQANANSLGGYTDWRVAIGEELRSLLISQGSAPFINATIFPSTPSDDSWTSTTCAGTITSAHVIGFGSDSEPVRDKDTTKYYVRLCRGGVLNTIRYGDIGVPGAEDFGVGLCKELPTGFSQLSGTHTSGNDNYGNYQYLDSSIMVWIPKFWYKIESNNDIDIRGINSYGTTTAANADGYALHRAFIDGGSEQPGFFIDKYMCSQNTYGGNEIASSIKLGLPISTHAVHNPIAALTACSANAHYESINAANARGSLFSVASRFQHAALAMLSMAHGQASSDATHCAWYDGTDNFPKGCNDNALGDTDDGTVSYISDGYSNCGKTGSGTPFAKTTHNGQANGVADLNGLMWEISLGVTAIRTTAGIEGMTRADPCVVTWTAHGLSTGDPVMIGDTDITQADWTALNDKIYAVTKVDNDSFSLDGVDSSGFAAGYDAGTDPGQIHKATFHVAKQATSIKDFTGGNSGATDHWGATGVAAMMDAFTPAFETGYASNGYSQRFGSGANQVLAEDVSGNPWLLSGLGFPKDTGGIDTTGTDLFGKDYFYQYFQNEMCLLACGYWYYGSYAGVWSVNWYGYRTDSGNTVGFRAACYP